jgi:predicted dehydrogenase
MKTPYTRRSFLQAGLTGLVLPVIVPRHVLGGRGYKAPSDLLAIACVGVGGMGRHYLEGCAHEKIVALCDLDFNFVNTRGVFGKYPDAVRYRDYREMLDKEQKNFDALIIAVPDHHHALLLMAAMQLSKHIYCAKPITHTIGEARKIKAELARHPALVTKASVQDSGTHEARSTTEILNSGVLGPVHELHIWTDHPIYPCALPRPPETAKPPTGMDWELWIGPAPYRPFHPVYHPENWRPWWDFGSGTVGDMACHSFHMYFNELKMHAPTTVYGYGSTRHEGFMKKLLTPECQSGANQVTWEYPQRGELPPLKVHWYDGGIKPIRPDELPHDLNMPDSGVLFVGEKGKLLSGYYGGNPFVSRRNLGPGRGLNGGLLLPEDRFTGFQTPLQTLLRCEKSNHYREWTEACKTGVKTSCPVGFACEMTEVALLGTLALRTQAFIEWDSRSMKVTNRDEPNQWVDPPYRSNYVI